MLNMLGNNSSPLKEKKKEPSIRLLYTGCEEIELDIYVYRLPKDIDLIYHLKHEHGVFGSISDYLVICFDAHGWVSSRDLINYLKVTFELLPSFK